MSMRRMNPVSAPPLEGVASPTGRIASLDQFRGYTVAGMLLVNFLGGFAVVPAILKHHSTYCSYADTIMPQFFFAVGIAYRLTFLKRLRDVGPLAATAAAVRRNLELIVLGFVATHAERLRGEKPRSDGGAGVPGLEPAVRGRVPSPAGHARRATHQQGYRLPPDAQHPGRQVPQETEA